MKDQNAITIDDEPKQGKVESSGTTDLSFESVKTLKSGLCPSLRHGLCVS